MSSNEPDPGRTLELLEGRMDSDKLTARRAAGAISVATIVLTVAGGLLIRVVDPDRFPTLGDGMWWAIQTLTTVGYGDIVPTNTGGRIIAAIVMLNGIAFLTVITAAVTATLIEQVRRRRAPDPVATADRDAVLARLDEISARLEKIEDAIEPNERERG